LNGTQGKIVWISDITDAVRVDVRGKSHLVRATNLRQNGEAISLGSYKDKSRPAPATNDESTWSGPVTTVMRPDSAKHGTHNDNNDNDINNEQPFGEPLDEPLLGRSNGNMPVTTVGLPMLVMTAAVPTFHIGDVDSQLEAAADVAAQTCAEEVAQYVAQAERKRDEALARLNAAAQCARTATHHAAKCAAVAAAVAIKAMAEAKCIVATTAKSIVCEFHPETGFAINDAARALCVAQWKGDVVHGAGSGQMHIDFEVLRTATNNFNGKYLLGVGASCRVFKANVYGYPTAIKCLTETAGVWDDKQLDAEMDFLRRVSHPHINNLLAASLNGANRCLILEYMNGGALDTRLLSTALPLLEWQDRALILLHVSRGLVHIHSLSPPVIHRDVKTGNVLLRYAEGPTTGADSSAGANSSKLLVAKVCSSV
jgi:hypothetical protein